MTISAPTSAKHRRGATGHVPLASLTLICLLGASACVNTVDSNGSGGAGPGDCTADETFCDGTCATLSNDGSNCGACGVRCGVDQHCADGACVDGVACPPGLIDCGGTCADTSSDLNHCGDCAAPCNNGTCEEGTCICPEGLTLCDGTCADPLVDVDHCGECGRSCHHDELCNEGRCECIDTVCGFFCGAITLPAEGSHTFEGYLHDINRFATNCGEGRIGNEQIFYLPTPPTGSVILLSAGPSEFKYSITVWDAQTCVKHSCVAPNGIDPFQHSLLLEPHQDMIIIVESVGLATGNYTMNITQYPHPLHCPETDLGNTTGSVSDDNHHPSSNHNLGSCGGVGPDDSYAFTAPTSGLYAFRTYDSMVDPVLYVRDTCQGSELACNDDHDGHESRVELNLTAGQEVIVFVDSAFSVGGDYNLEVLGPL